LDPAGPNPGEKGKTPGLFSDVSFNPQNYAIGSTVAEGGVGAIHQATDLNIRRTVAVKVLRDDKTLSREDVLRFVQEAQITGQLEHPNIVPVYELGQKEDQSPYYAMKLIHGITLEDVLENINKGDQAIIEKYSLAMLLTIFEKICDAVAFAHSRGIVHRDLKPGNVMVGEYGEVLVLDWGMAKIMGQESPRKTLSEPSSSAAIEGVRVRDSNLTIGCGYILGTPSYMAPEQAANQPIDPRTDIYALGGILYAILALRPPHEEGEVYEMLQNIKDGRILSPLTYNSPPRAKLFDVLFRKTADRAVSPRFPHCPAGQIPESLSMISMKALALKSEDRYQEVRDLQKDIQAYQDGFITSAETKGLFKSLKLLIRRHRVESALIAVSLLVILFLTVAYAMGERTKRLALQARLKAEEDRRRLEEKTEAERRRNWRLRFSEDFSGPDFLSRWETDGPWKVKDGELRIGGVEQCVRFKTPVVGDVRMVFDCQKDDGPLSDISVFLGGLKTSALAGAFQNGYLFQYGGNLNRRIRLISPNAILWSKCASPLKRGWRYHVEVRKTGNRLVLMIDGQTIVDVSDERPLYGAEHAYVGFYNYKTETRYSNIKVYTHDPALAADLLETAEELLSRGSRVAARELFRQVLDSSQDAKRTAQAEKGFAKAARDIQAVEDFPSIRARLRKIWPKAVVTLGTSGIVVNIRGLDIGDLSPLRGLRVSELRCDNNRITSLEPLRDMELTSLRVDANCIASLEPLRGMPLISLICDNNQIRDLEPLRGMNLKALSCGLNPISSLNPLRGMKQLDYLQVGNAQIASLEPLRGVRLNDLDVSGNQIASLEPLRGMSLNQLYIDNNQIEDLSPLQDADLLSLNCSRNRIASLEPIGKMYLERLKCSGNRIEDLGPLKEMDGLSFLDCRNNPLKTLEPVVQRPPRRWLFDIEQLRSADRALLEARSGQALYAENLRNARVRLYAKQKDGAGLRSIAVPFGGHFYLLIQQDATWAEARKMCEELGGHLVVITSAAENDFIRSQCEPGINWCFIGLALEGSKRKWVTDEPFEFSRLEVSPEFHGNAIIGEDGNWLPVLPRQVVSGFIVEWDR
jgi:serine/threonine protein kinase